VCVRYPNGTIYEGSFQNGLRCDIGRLYKPNQQQQQQQKNKSNLEWEVVGHWIDNQPSSTFPFKINVPGIFEYWGYVMLSKKRSIELLDIEDFHKIRQGELFVIESKTVFFGEFKNNMKNGFGVLQFGTMDRYYGNFKNDQFHRSGTFFYKDGSIFQGSYFNGVRKGKGVMLLPTGDKIDGEWNGTEVKGNYIKGSVQNCSVSTLSLIKHEIDSQIRQVQHYGYMTKECHQSCSNSTASKWSGYFTKREELWKQEKQYFVTKYGQGHMSSLVSFRSLVNDLLKGDKQSPHQFINSMVNFFKSCFDGSFSTNRSKSAKNKYSLISRACEDVQSFIVFLTDLLWDYVGSQFVFMFTMDKHDHDYEFHLRELEERFQHLQQQMNPSTPLIDKQLQQQQQQQQTMDHITPFVDITTADESKIRCKKELAIIVSDFVHISVSNSLFPLYTESYRENDLFITQKIEQLMDTNLQQLGVPEQFWPIHSEEIAFDTSITLLKELPQKRGVRSKIEVLFNLRVSVMQELKHYREQYRKRFSEETGRQYTPDFDWQPAADDVTGVYTYVFIKASLRNYYAEFKYINDWRDASIETNPVSHMLSFYEGFLQFIADIHPNLKKPNGEFISTFTLSDSLKNSVITEILQFRNQISEPFYWLPSLLIFLSLEVEPISGKTGQYLVISKTKKLHEELNKNLNVVQRILSRCKDIGFQIEYEQETGDLIVVLSNVYPTHIYAELSLNMKRFIQFELLFIE
jgi:hypothetical protein